MPAFNAIIADSLPFEQRGAGYGAYRMITSTPQMVAPFIGGIVLDWMGYQKGVQIFMVVEFLVALVVTYFRWRMLRETIERFEGKLRLWEQQVAMSTLTVRLTTRATFRPAEALGLGEEAQRTLATSWQAMVDLGRALLLVLIAIVPWAIPLVLVILMLRLLLRRARRRPRTGS